jgi:hypothetical protein
MNNDNANGTYSVKKFRTQIDALKKAQDEKHQAEVDALATSMVENAYSYLERGYLPQLFTPKDTAYSSVKLGTPLDEQMFLLYQIHLEAHPNITAKELQSSLDRMDPGFHLLEHPNLGLALFISAETESD